LNIDWPNFLTDFICKGIIQVDNILIEKLNKKAITNDAGKTSKLKKNPANSGWVNIGSEISLNFHNFFFFVF